MEPKNWQPKPVKYLNERDRLRQERRRLVREWNLQLQEVETAWAALQRVNEEVREEELHNTSMDDGWWLEYQYQHEDHYRTARNQLNLLANMIRGIDSRLRR